MQRIEKARPQLQSDAKKLHDEIAALEKELTHGEWRTRIADQRLKLEAERASTSYSDEELSKVEDSVKALKDASQALKLAQAAEKQIPTHRNDLTSADQELEGKLKRKQELDAKLVGAAELSTKIEQTEVVVAEKNANVQRIQTTLDELKQRHYQLSSDIDRCNPLGTIQKLTTECVRWITNFHVADLPHNVLPPWHPHLIIRSAAPALANRRRKLLAQLSDDPSASIHLNPKKPKPTAN